MWTAVQQPCGTVCNQTKSSSSALPTGLETNPLPGAWRGVMSEEDPNTGPFSLQGPLPMTIGQGSFKSRNTYLRITSFGRSITCLCLTTCTHKPIPVNIRTTARPTTICTPLSIECNPAFAVISRQVIVGDPTFYREEPSLTGILFHIRKPKRQAAIKSREYFISMNISNLK